MSADPSDTADAAETWGHFHFRFPASPTVASPRPKDPGPDPRKLAITAKAYADLLLRMLPITNLGLTRPRIYTASRNQPTLKDHAGCVNAVDTWLRKFDKDIETKPDFLTTTCSPLAEVWVTLQAFNEAKSNGEKIAFFLNAFQESEYVGLQIKSDFSTPPSEGRWSVRSGNYVDQSMWQQQQQQQIRRQDGAIRRFRCTRLPC